jgi:5-methyltetrahydrofolate--homocysteine methyltransferase
MIPCEDIINAAIEHNVDLIGLSGLITPSLDEMVTVAKTLQHQKLKIPLIVGGASTSELHTAVFLNPLYDGGVYHTKDASHGVQVVRELTSLNSRLMSETSKKSFVEQTQNHYKNLKTAYENKQAGRCLDSTRHDGVINIDWNTVGVENFRPLQLQNVPLENLIPYIEWRYFFHAWGVKNDTVEKQKILDDANVLLKKIICKKLLTVNAVYGIFDYENNPTCAFACTILGADDLAKTFENDGDSYSALLTKTLADRLAEAFAEHLNREIFQGNRVAVGYPSYPDHSQKKYIFDLLSAEENIGIQLTETFMMTPAASVCGLILAK